MNCAFAQFTDRFWCFGDSAAIDFHNLANPVPSTCILRSRGTCATICDSSGNLLFYASDPHVDLWLIPGTYDFGYIVNKNNQIMDNGDSLKTTAWYQEMIITPDPSNGNRFYLFHAGVTNTTNPGFYYSVVDLSYNATLGRVIQKNIQLQTFPVCDGLAAVKHGNGRDWWVVLKHWNTVNNDFYFYLVTPSGINGPFVQSLGTASDQGFARMKFTKEGNKLFVINPNNLIESFNFDRCSGMLSNINTIQPQISSGSNTGNWSLAFSPNSTKLYVAASDFSNSNNYIFQYDLTATNILASRDTIYTFDPPSIAGLLQTGPDGKIYSSCPDALNDCGPFYLYCDTSYYLENMNLSVINYPDSLGAACDFQPYSFFLGGHRTYMGLPNNPNYELGADTNSFCDTVLTIKNQQFEGSKDDLFVFYHSQWQTVFINAKALQGKSYSLEVFDVLGKIIYQEEGKLNSEYYSKDLHVESFSNGLYIVSLQTERERLVKRFVKD